MPTIPGELCPWIDRQFTDDDGNPLVGGLVYSYVTGTTTPKPTYADATLETENTNPLELDGTGRGTMFLEAGGYDFQVHDATDSPIYTVTAVESVAVTFLSSLGITLATGAQQVTSGYEVLDTDQFVTIDGTGGPDPCVINLPEVADRGLQLTLKNQGDVDVAVTPFASDTIDGAAGVFTLPAAAAGVFPTITFYPTAAGWLIQSGWNGFA